VIWGDGTGQSNVSAYSHGVMGYKTPNIGRIAAEGMMFTDYYGEIEDTGPLRLWANPFTPLRMPLLFNLRRDPYERAQLTSNTYIDWVLDHAYVFIPAQAYVRNFISTFEDNPPRQKAASFGIDHVMEQLEQNLGSH
jgi:hypothetical protein